jgi:Short C-terminal domain
MFVGPRRPLLGAAMLGGTYLAGRASQRSSYREHDQDARLEQLESQQQPPAPPPPAATPAPPAPSAAAAPSVADQLKQLGDLKASGVLSDDEFEAAKHKLLAS